MYNHRLLLSLLLLLSTLLIFQPCFAYDTPPTEPAESAELPSKTLNPALTPLAAATIRLEAAEKTEDFSAMLAAAEDALLLASDQRKPGFAIKTATAAWWLGQREFGNANWTEATVLFNRIAALARQYPQIAKTWGTDALDMEAHLQLSRRMQEIPRRQPEYTHRFLLVFLHEVAIDQPGMSNNQLIGKTILTDQQKTAAVRAFTSLRGYLEAMSLGKFSSTFSTVEYPGTVSAFRLRRDDTTQPPIEMREPDTNYASPTLWSLLHDHYQQADSIVYIWGGGSRLASVATGGARLHPLIPWTLNSPLRGFMQIPGQMLLNRYAPVLVMHEFFHSVEQMVGIKPGHGYKPAQRDQFADWKGNGQLDYYRWHFDTTIPRQFNLKKEFKSELGWANLNFATRYPEKPFSRSTLARIAELAAPIPAADRRMAIELLQQAQPLIKAKKHQQALPLLQNALRLHPIHPDIQLELGRLYEQAGNYQSALEIYQARHTTYPDYQTIRGLATAHQKLQHYPQAADLHGQAADLATISANRLSHLLLRAHAFMHDKQYQTAFNAYQQVIQESPRLSPNDTKLLADAYYQSGLLLADHLGTPQDGIILLQQAIAAGHNNPEGIKRSLARISRKAS